MKKFIRELRQNIGLWLYIAITFVGIIVYLDSEKPQYITGMVLVIVGFVGIKGVRHTEERETERHRHPLKHIEDDLDPEDHHHHH